MEAEGCRSFFAQDRLAVMGLIEPLKRLPELLRIRRYLREYFLANPPDVFVGIDSPDFNLSLEESLRKAGIKTVHYVSPSVWAWRQGRIKKIARAVDLVLTLFPFEEKFYQDHASSYPNLRAVCVGHPLADSIPMQSDSAAARTALAIPLTSPVVALLPGSRAGEVERMGRLFFDVARWCIAQKKALLFVVPAANRARKMQLQTMLANYPELAVQLVDGKSQLCMAASDVVLMASGTTTLEAMLLKKPMVVAYKMAKLSYAIISRLLKVPYVSLPNLLANKKLVPEFLQETATVENLGQALLNVFNNPAQVQEMQQQFITIHKDIQRDASRCAARAIVALQDW